MSDFFKLQPTSSVISWESGGGETKPNLSKWFIAYWILLLFSAFPTIVFLKNVAFGNFLFNLKHNRIKNGFWHTVQFAVV